MIELIVLDVDGTLTDGSIFHTNNGDELKAFDVKDGLGVASWTKKLGKKAAIITGRKSKLLEKRAQELGITHLYQGVDNKDEILQDILDREALRWSQVAAIGDDLNDYKMLQKAGLSFAPNDASHYVKDIVKVVCKSNGGRGAVREMIEYIFKAQDQEEEFLKLWV